MSSFSLSYWRAFGVRREAEKKEGLRAVTIVAMRHMRGH
jgi:hypothetical protein